jgi:ABC-type lipoprotein export system ATPase subunit
VNGLFLAIECKAGKGKTTALQDLNIAHIKKCGGIALVINESNIDELNQHLENLTNVRKERT